jgi:hypothetical protein
MGGGGSTTINQEFNMQMTNELLYNSVQNNTSIDENRMENIQDMDLQILRTVGCNVKTAQTTKSSFLSSTEHIAQSFQQVETQLASALKQQASAALDKQTQMGNFQFGDRQNINQKMDTEIENIVNTQLQTNNLKTTINDSINIQGQVIKIGEAICFDGETLSFEQDISADLAAQSVSRNLLSAVNSSSVVNDIIAEGEASSSTFAGGAAEAVESVGEAASKVGMALMMPYLISIVGVVLCLIVSMVVFGGMFKSNPQAATNLAKSMGSGASSAASQFGKPKIAAPGLGRSMAFKK